MQPMACLRSFASWRTRLDHQLRREIDFQGPNVFKKNAPTAMLHKCTYETLQERFSDPDIAKIKNLGIAPVRLFALFSSQMNR